MTETQKIEDAAYEAARRTANLRIEEAAAEAEVAAFQANRGTLGAAAATIKAMETAEYVRQNMWGRFNREWA